MGGRSSWSVLALAIALLYQSSASALITGGEGNRPVSDPGWPAGAEPIFNWESRIAWWEGPPLGGGQWHAEAKGDAAEINKVLEAFAKIDAPVKRVLIRDGVGFSFWLDPNRTRSGNKVNRDHKIDWEFTVWTKGGWQNQQKLPAEMRAAKGERPECTLTIYTGTVRWDQLRMPEGLTVTDNTLQGNGYSKSDGRVLEGTVRDFATGKPLQATIRVERITAKKTGGYDYSAAETVKVDSSGVWVLKKFPAEWSRLIAEADGFAPRIIHHARYDRQPGYTRCDCSLIAAGAVSGRVVDSDGASLGNADIVVRSVATDEGNRYAILQSRYSTDGDGRFSISGLPRGSCRITAYIEGYQGGLGSEVKIPEKDCKVILFRAGSVRVSVDFPKERSVKDYIINIAPVGGEEVGSWGGSSSLNAENFVEFKNVPPGDYIVHGRPNPGSQSDATDKVQITVHPAKSTEITLKAN